MTREEQIKKQALDSTIGIVGEYNGFIMGAKWADEHPNGNLIRWQSGEPEEDYCFCFVTTKRNIVRDGLWIKGRGWSSGSLSHKIDVVAWYKLIDIEPYKEEAK